MISNIGRSYDWFLWVHIMIIKIKHPSKSNELRRVYTVVSSTIHKVLVVIYTKLDHHYYDIFEKNCHFDFYGILLYASFQFKLA